jgi:hypothetical protein
VVIVLASCSESAGEPENTTGLTEVPEPHPVTCDLATEVLTLADEILGTLEDFGGDWRPNLASSYIERARVLSVEASVVSATDPWALQVEGAASAVLDTFEDVGNRPMRANDLLVPTGFSDVLNRCL